VRNRHLVSLIILMIKPLRYLSSEPVCRFTSQAA